MPLPRNFTTATVIAEAAGEIAGRRLQRPLAPVALRDRRSNSNYLT
jgi:hypothetical protein